MIDADLLIKVAKKAMYKKLHRYDEDALQEIITHLIEYRSTDYRLALRKAHAVRMKIYRLNKREIPASIEEINRHRIA